MLGKSKSFLGGTLFPKVTGFAIGCLFFILAGCCSPGVSEEETPPSESMAESSGVVVVPSPPLRAGGWEETTLSSDPKATAVWRWLQEKNEDLPDNPELCQTQVVAGIKYRFTSLDGTIITVWEHPDGTREILP